MFSEFLHYEFELDRRDLYGSRDLQCYLTHKYGSAFTLTTNLNLSKKILKSKIVFNLWHCSRLRREGVSGFNQPFLLLFLSF